MKALPMRFLPMLVVLAGPCALMPASGVAAPPADPSAVVTAMVSSLARMLSNPKLSAGDREREFARLLDEDCDLARVARFVLGSYGDAANDGDRAQFGRLFERWITHMFAGKIGRFDASTFTVKAVTPADDGAIVTTQIAEGDHPIRIDWRVSANGGAYRIVDVALEGISMALVEREEIGAVIRRNGGTVAGLNHVLEERLASNDTTTAVSTTASTSP